VRKYPIAAVVAVIKAKMIKKKRIFCVFVSFLRQLRLSLKELVGGWGYI
jgi:hypothetical protein